MSIVPAIEPSTVEVEAIGRVLLDRGLVTAEQFESVKEEAAAAAAGEKPGRSEAHLSASSRVYVAPGDGGGGPASEGSSNRTAGIEPSTSVEDFTESFFTCIERAQASLPATMNLSSKADKQAGFKEAWALHADAEEILRNPAAKAQFADSGGDVNQLWQLHAQLKTSIEEHQDVAAKDAADNACCGLGALMRVFGMFCYCKECTLSYFCREEGCLCTIFGVACLPCYIFCVHPFFEAQRQKKAERLSQEGS